jgi:uncharacterized protein (TIGR01777 family)
MKNKKIIIAGGSGFIGEEMIRYFGKDNKIVILTRLLPNTSNNRNQYSSLTSTELSNTTFIQWDGKTIGGWYKELEAADIIVNMAGKSVNCRYTAKNKREIIDSRINATKVIGEAINKLVQPPKLWINASSATIYRHAADKPQDELTGEIKDDFSVRVCKQWEETLYEQRTPFTRKIALRMAITLGSGGVMIPYFNLLKFGLGGKQGNGKQMYSWVHIEDTCRMIEYFYEHDELEGTFNCSSPNPVSNEEFMKTLRKATDTTIGLPAFEWMLKLGAIIIGTETELILKSRWVIPTKALQAGFVLKYPHLTDALEQVISATPKKQYKLW